MYRVGTRLCGESKYRVFDAEDINVTFVVKCSFYIKDELLYSFQYSTYPKYFISASNNLYSSVLKEIEERDFSEIERVDKDMSGLCDSIEDIKVRGERRAELFGRPFWEKEKDTVSVTSEAVSLRKYDYMEDDCPPPRSIIE